MKLLAVLLLAALPLYCYAGSGCQFLEDILTKAFSLEVSVDELQDFVKEFVHDDATKNAVAEIKQCYLNQSNETLDKVQDLTNLISNSKYCALF